MSSPNNLNAGMRCIKFIIFVISFMFGVSWDGVQERVSCHPPCLVASSIKQLFPGKWLDRAEPSLSVAIIERHKTVIDN